MQSVTTCIVIGQPTVCGGRIYRDVLCVLGQCVLESLCVKDCVSVSLVSAIIYFEYS